jgi:hypothetical protein
MVVGLRGTGDLATSGFCVAALRDPDDEKPHCGANYQYNRRG